MHSTATEGGGGGEKRVMQCEQGATIHCLRTAISEQQEWAASLVITSSMDQIMFNNQLAACVELREIIIKH